MLVKQHGLNDVEGDRLLPELEQLRIARAAQCILAEQLVRLFAQRLENLCHDAARDAAQAHLVAPLERREQLQERIQHVLLGAGRRGAPIGQVLE